MKMPIAWTQKIFFHFKWKWEHETEHQPKAPARVGLACRAQLVHTRHITSKKRAQEGIGCYTGEGESKQGDRTTGLWWKGRGRQKEKPGKKLLMAPGSLMVTGQPRQDGPAPTTERCKDRSETPDLCWAYNTKPLLCGFWKHFSKWTAAPYLIGSYSCSGSTRTLVLRKSVCLVGNKWNQAHRADSLLKKTRKIATGTRSSLQKRHVCISAPGRTVHKQSPWLSLQHSDRHQSLRATLFKTGEI